MTLGIWEGRRWAWLWTPVGLWSAGHHQGMSGPRRWVGLGWMEMCIIPGCGDELVPWAALRLTLCLG